MSTEVKYLSAYGLRENFNLRDNESTPDFGYEETIAIFEGSDWRFGFCAQIGMNLPNWKLKISYPNLVDKSLCISLFEKGEYPSVFRKKTFPIIWKVRYLSFTGRFWGWFLTRLPPRLSVANEGADKRLSRTTYRFVGHNVRALPEYPNWTPAARTWRKRYLC